MRAALFSIVPYERPVAQKGWPVAAADYDAETAQASMRRALDFFELADEVGFDWVSVAEHHYAPGSLTPNPMVMAGALAQRVKRAKIALLGSNIPIQNPLRVAEEFAMLDTLTGGRVIAGMLRGTSNEYVTYGVNPAESRERFMEALALMYARGPSPSRSDGSVATTNTARSQSGPAPCRSRIRRSSCRSRAPRWPSSPPSTGSVPGWR